MPRIGPLFCILAALAAGHDLHGDQEAPKKIAHKESSHKEEYQTVGAGTAGRNETRSSIMHMVCDAVENQLNKGVQWLNALIATIIALVMIMDGEFVFKYIVVGMISIFAYLFTMSEVDTQIGTAKNLDNILCHIIAGEVAVAIAVVAYKGYAGIQISLGLALGGVFFHYLHDSMQQSSALEGLISNHILAVIIGNVCVLIGLVMLKGKIYNKVMAITSSFVGGGLLAASCGFFLEFFCVHIRGLKHYLTDSGFSVPSHCPPWEAFLKALISRNAVEVGLLHEKYKVKLGGSDIFLDRWIGYFLWFIFTIFGLCWQIKVERKRQAKVAVAGTGVDVPLLSSDRRT